MVVDDGKTNGDALSGGQIQVARSDDRAEVQQKPMILIADRQR
jgi:hypothetical protein